MSQLGADIAAEVIDAHVRAARRDLQPSQSLLDALRRAQPNINWSKALAERYGIVVLEDLSTAGAPAWLETQGGTGGVLFHTTTNCTYIAVPDPFDVIANDELLSTCPAGTELAAAANAVIEAARRDSKRGDLWPQPVTAAPADGAFSAIEYVNQAVTRALAVGASDIHFEVGRDGLEVKFRLDGVITRHGELTGIECADEVISRIKVLAQLDITERRLPQDGRIRFEGERHAVDLRVSIMPSVFAEDAVLRVLDKSHLKSRSDGIDLQGLGFAGRELESMRRLASLPHGMLLITGPTGSGKTTTIYAALSEINQGHEKIITIEDPVEYELPGVLQIPVNERKGLTFAKGLRSILRHDPDRILVGEIRDAETAEIAVQASLTGHLVYTTVHANSLFDVIGRFRHFDLDLFGFVSALNGVVVQRLLRRACPVCVQQRKPTDEQARWLVRHRVAVPSTVPHAVGCSVCHGTGYRQRIVVAEVHEVDDEVRAAILRGADIGQLKAIVFADDRPPLSRQAINLVAKGETTLEEVHRVIGLA